MAKRTRSPETQAAKNARTARYRKKNPQRHAARRAVEKAVREGVLIPQKCFCGADNAHAHHEDYAQPLCVVWLCRFHHEERHRQLGSYKGHRTSTARGATFRKQSGKWQAQISIKGKSKYLGSFNTEDEAKAAYAAARERPIP